jgi:hypothetical protein
MQKRSVSWAVIAAVFVAAATSALHGQTANSVVSYVSYNAGTGSANGFNSPNSALGMPSTFTAHEFGVPVDPYNPPFLAEQLVSIGSGGSLTLQLDAPVRNDPANAFGFDFIIYGNSGFIITDFGAGTTSGDLFGASAPGSTQVSVSADNITFYKLETSLAPVVDRYYPTDGSGLFGFPVNPAVTPASFSGKDLNGIRALDAGSAGGAAFDLGWARDGAGNPVSLDSIGYIRIDVLSGAAEIDGVVGVPEPQTWALFAIGVAGLLLRKRKL